MTNPITCMRCQSPMEEGFLLDRTYGGLLQTRWCEGKPDGSGWFGDATRSQADRGRRVVSYRCTGCGLIESYVTDRETRQA